MNADEHPFRVFIVGRSRAARVEIRTILEEAGVEVAGEAATVRDVPLDARGADAIVSADEGPAAERRTVSDDALVEALTPREQQVLELAAEGLSNRAIAARLDISEHTVKFHLSAVYGKLGVATRAEAVRHGVRRGLITI